MVVISNHLSSNMPSQDTAVVVQHAGRWKIRGKQGKPSSLNENRHECAQLHRITIHFLTCCKHDDLASNCSAQTSSHLLHLHTSKILQRDTRLSRIHVGSTAVKQERSVKTYGCSLMKYNHPIRPRIMKLNPQETAENRIKYPTDRRKSNKPSRRP